jgi:hypothetical protein
VAAVLGRESLTWAQVVQMTSIADFHLLAEMNNDIRTAPWTQPASREATRLYFRVKRAKEEIRRLNVEIRRQVTYMIEEYSLYSTIIADLRHQDPVLAVYLERESKYQDNIFSHITTYLLKTQSLPGFTGSLVPGQRTGCANNITITTSHPSWLKTLLSPAKVPRAGGKEHTVDEDIDDDDGDDEERDTGLIIDLVEKLASM